MVSIMTKTRQPQIPDEAIQFIRSHYQAVSLMLYLADFKMPDTTAINKRRNEVAKWVLRACGYETLADQQKAEQVETENRQAMALCRKLEKEIKEAVANLEDEEKIEWQRKRLADAGQNANRLGSLAKKRRAFVAAFRDSHLAFVSLPQAYSVLETTVSVGQSESERFLSDLLATGGSILVYGTPETSNSKPLYVSEEERDLLREMQRIWGIR